VKASAEEDDTCKEEQHRRVRDEVGTGGRRRRTRAVTMCAGGCTFTGKPSWNANFDAAAVENAIVGAYLIIQL